MKIVGIGRCEETSRSCSSSPFIPGIRQSVIRQALSREWPDDRNSSPDANAMTENPRDSTISLIAFQPDSYSPTIQITLFCLNRPIRRFVAKIGPPDEAIYCQGRSVQPQSDGRHHRQDQG